MCRVDSISSFKFAQTRRKGYDPAFTWGPDSTAQEHSLQLDTTSHVRQNNFMLALTAICSDLKVYQVWEGPVQLNIVKHVPVLERWPDGDPNVF